MRRVLRAAYYVFLVAGIMALGYAGYAALDLYWYQDVEMSKFEAISARVSTEPRTIEAPPVADGDVIGEIEMPRLGLKAIVVQGDSEELLDLAVGHLPETALPGETGNVALAGHRDGLFRPLRDVRPGDSVILKMMDREFEYQVEWTAVVPPTEVGVVQRTSEPALTLVTCFPFHYIGAAPERFIVRARAVAPMASSEHSVPADERENLEDKQPTVLHDHLRRLFVQGTRAIMQQRAKLASGLSAWLAQLTSRAYTRLDSITE